MKILVTGAAGFIGFHLIKRISITKPNAQIVGIDNMNDYYSVDLKESRLKELLKIKNFHFLRMDLSNKVEIDKLFDIEKFDYVVNLAAQAGVRYSLVNPHAYIESNIGGFLNILEASKNHKIKHLLFASSSSVYGGNTQVPYSTEDNVDHPVSLYAATKKSNELMAHSYSHLYNIPVTGLRFFTVVGPFGRPDMAYFSFAEKISKGEEIKIFNHGKMERDFTYVEDVVEAVDKLIEHLPKANLDWENSEERVSTSWAPYRIFNIGNSSPVSLLKFVETLENKLGKKAQKVYLDMQPGDVVKTCADVSGLEAAINFKPSTSLDEGISKFVEWYKKYYIS